MFAVEDFDEYHDFEMLLEIKALRNPILRSYTSSLALLFRARDLAF